MNHEHPDLKGRLAASFPAIRGRDEICRIIASRPDLNDQFQRWSPEAREEFLAFCSGARGVKVVYDGIFKEIFNPEAAPERLEDILSLLLNRRIRIDAVLPNDSVRLGAESSLLYTDIIVQQQDGSLSNVEIQKIGYAFPGQRSACYSADHLLRQYKRVRGEKGKRFNYQDIKSVYTIVFFEASPREFRRFPANCIHKFSQCSDTGLELELLQEYVFVSLDIFRKNMDNKSITNDLEAWLAFLSFDDPERIEELILKYPKFRAMYQDIYEICLNMERVMSMYSKELEELDRNTVRYMIDEMQAEADQLTAKLEEMKSQYAEAKSQLDESKSQLAESESQLAESKSQLAESKSQLAEKDSQLAEKDSLIKELQAALAAERQRQKA